MQEYTTLIALGSNLGDRQAHLVRALAFLEGLSLRPLRCSSVYESEPVGPAEEPYLNMVAELHWDGSPEYLLHQLKLHEMAQGRNLHSERWTSRPIDLDIIALHPYIIDTPDLSIPHLLYSERLFVLLPLQELHPEWTDPRTGIPIDALIRAAPELKMKKWGDI